MPQKSNMDKNAGILPLIKGPTDSGGGPSINGKTNGNLETGNTDKEGHGTTESLTGQSASGSKPANVDKTAEIADNNIESNNLYEAMENLIKRFKTQDSGIKLLISEISNLKAAQSLTRSDKIKTCIEDIYNMSNKVETSRYETVRAFKSLPLITRNMVLTEKKEETKENQIPLKETAEASTSTPCWWDMDQNPRRGDTWSNVVKAKGKAKPSNHITDKMNSDEKTAETIHAKPPENQGTRNTNKSKNKTKRTRQARPDSIAIKPSDGESSKSILSTIRKEVNLTQIGVAVESIRESRGGELLIQLTKNNGKRKELGAALQQTLGKKAKVRELIQFSEIEILGLDGVTTETEVLDALRLAAKLTDEDTTVKIRSLRTGLGGTKRATATLRTSDANHIVTAGKIEIGWVKAKVRLKIKATKCYRCLCFGHTKHSCSGPDRTNMCSLCTEMGHKAVDCTANPRCTACLDIGEEAGHYSGSSRCVAHKRALLPGTSKTISGAPSTQVQREVARPNIQ